MNKATPFSMENQPLFSEITTLIEQSRQQVAVTINATMSMLYWQIGKRINDEVLNNERAEYGKHVVQNISNQLLAAYGKGWGEKQLRHCMQFAEVFPNTEIVYTLCGQLSWSHIRLVMFISEPLKRSFYIEMCKLEKWSVRTFRERINSMLYERTAISKKPELTITNELEQLKNEQAITPDWVFRNPYFLAFLGLTGATF
jgi:hypothetical protein